LTNRIRKLTRNVFRDIATSTAAIGRSGVLVKNLNNEYNRSGCVNNSTRHTASIVITFRYLTNRMLTRIRFKGINVSLSAKQNNLFVNRCNSFKFLWFITSYASFKSQFNIISDIYCVKSAIESNSVKTDICPRDICILGSDIAGSVDNIIAVFAQTYPDVFVTISISATVVDAIGFNASYITLTEIRSTVRSKSAIRHGRTLLGLN
jgi:hypothetical protein